jgi:hypothetical protein
MRSGHTGLLEAFETPLRTWTAKARLPGCKPGSPRLDFQTVGWKGCFRPR